ncbi:MAG TPA: 4-hydroxy-tetrahydrodipicolinate synthase [Fimbriimonadaceae bacterium]|nr:4-hydroxy-tetrahydrodipicolinate synthase [Fimbriimonadaceae bacterium]HRJ34070.1 4-hydroxy-tetrahydrodipicolinate synthase [Fimbriimonadaceae bacterium]
MGAFHGPRDWGTLLTAMLTPFDERGDVNLAEAARVARYLVDEMENDGLVVAGTTGESPTLDPTEKLSLLETVLESVGDRAAVIFGAGTYNTRESIHMAQEAARRGAHGIMAVNPYYNKPGQPGLEAHFRAIAEATELPLMLYNIQPRSSINLETPTLLRLAEHPQVVAVKEASGNLNQISEVCARVPAGFRVYSGDDGLTLPILSLGGFGLVSVAAHVVGRELKQMMRLAPTDLASATRIHQSLREVFRVLFQWPSPVPVKFALSQRGFDCARVRLPLTPLEPEARSEIDRVMAAFAGS